MSRGLQQRLRETGIVTRTALENVGRPTECKNTSNEGAIIAAMRRKVRRKNMETALHSSILPQRRNTGSSEEENLPELEIKKFDRRRIPQNRFWRGILQERIYRRSILQDNSTDRDNLKTGFL